MTRPAMAKPPAHSAAEREAAHSGVTDEAGRHRPADRRRRLVHLRPRRAPSDAHQPPRYRARQVLQL